MSNINIEKKQTKKLDIFVFFAPVTLGLKYFLTHLVCILIITPYCDLQ